MVGSILANAAPAVAELSLNEKWISSAKVVLTGFIVVFAMLFLLILVIKIYSTVVSKAQEKSIMKAHKKEKIAQPNDSLKKPVLHPVSKSPEAPVVQDGIDNEVIAVIAAAVSTIYGPKTKVKIKSVRKSGGRSAWANAGILENTRPF
ncbi:MAG: OadG family protein [Ruminococcus sp.]|nr:OadG family protein [Ruminococcus sp.]